MRGSEQLIKGENVDANAGVAEVQAKVYEVQTQAENAVQQEAEYKTKLSEALAAADKRADAQEQAKETKDKINETVGG